MKRILCVVVSAFLISVGVIAFEDLREAPWLFRGADCVYRYSEIYEFQAIRKGFLQNLLQRMVDATYLKGFEHLGDVRDFDHCHILSHRDSLVSHESDVFALLCHTQEQASRYGKEPGKYFDYIDREGRNWIVWVDPKKGVENARKYRFSHSTEYWKKVYDPHFTINANMLDPKKLGYSGDHRETQFSFPRIACPEKWSDISNIIDVKLPTGQRICLALENITCHFTPDQCAQHCLKE